MTAQQTADVIANAREAVAKRNADYLERTIAALADTLDAVGPLAVAADRQAFSCDCTCQDCMTVQRMVDACNRIDAGHAYLKGRR